MDESRDNDADRVRRVAGERGLTSCMNDTKWREVCEAFRAWSHLPPRFRVFDVLANEGYTPEWDREWYYHPRPYVSIRFMEIELPPDAVPRAVAACKAIGAAVEVGGAGIRIWGWVGPADLPEFA